MMGCLVLILEIHQSPLEIPSAIVPSIERPETQTRGPSGPVSSINGPIRVQESCQKLSVIPEPISQTRNSLAVRRSLQIDFQIQLSFCLASSVLKFGIVSLLTLIQEAHKEPFSLKISHISYSARTLFHSSTLLRPKPPQILGVQTEIQETFPVLLNSVNPSIKNHCTYVPRLPHNL